MRRFNKIKSFEIDGFRPFENVTLDGFIDFLVLNVNCKKCPVIKNIDDIDECDMCFENLKKWFLDN